MQHAGSAQGTYCLNAVAVTQMLGLRLHTELAGVLTDMLVNRIKQPVCRERASNRGSARLPTWTG